MNQQALIAQILAQRERWLEVEPGKRLKLRRPDRWGAQLFRKGDLDLLLAQVVDWEGFTEADLLGQAIGAEDPVPFGPDLFRTVARDRLDWIEQITTQLLDMIQQAFEKEEADAKN